MTTKDTVTPLAAARAFAAEHPDFEGRINVKVLRPSGRGGWKGFARHTVTAWVRDGQAALRKELREGNVEAWPWNGHCVACGRIHLEPVLRRGHPNGERVGQPLGPENAAERAEFERRMAYFGKGAGEPVYAPRCTLHGVCPACAEALWMAPLTSWKGAGRDDEIECPPAGFVLKPAPPVVEIDLTGVGQ